MLSAGQKTPQVVLLLDDWSLDSTRYRRKVQGQSGPPADHNGTATFLATIGATQVAAPEFDQARVLASRLPAAAAEVMLRRTEYVLKVSKSQLCESGDICVDVFRTWNSTLPLLPEQQWKIATATGLPVSVRFQIPNVGHGSVRLWEEVYFLRYATEDGLVLPVSVVTKSGGKAQSLTFISLQKSPGFDTAKFDQEAAQ
jgi:hypothetical protein